MEQVRRSGLPINRRVAIRRSTAQQAGAAQPLLASTTAPQPGRVGPASAARDRTRVSLHADDASASVHCPADILDAEPFTRLPSGRSEVGSAGSALVRPGALPDQLNVLSQVRHARAVIRLRRVIEGRRARLADEFHHHTH